jgi:hypothetical protein
MSLASYTKARKAYEAGDETALDRMTAAVTPKVADKIGEIEHAAAEHRWQQAQAAAFAAEVAGQARRSARRARVRRNLITTVKVAGISLAAGVVALVVALMLTPAHHPQPGIASYQNVQPLPALTPDPSLPASFTASTGPGWVSLFVKGVREDVIHVSSLSTLTDQAGNLYLVITPWGGQAYDMRLGGTTDYQFSKDRP